jgi:hypothetical protein
LNAFCSIVFHYNPSWPILSWNHFPYPSRLWQVFFVVFDKSNIFAIIALGDWWRKWKQAITISFHIKCKYISFPSKLVK